MKPKNEHAQALGRIGGKATADSMTAEQRKARSAKALKARWAGKTDAERKAHSQLMLAGRKPKRP